MDHYAKKRKPNSFGKSGYNSKKPSYNLGPGLKGFLCTCNFREKECIRESYNLLNEYSDKLYGDDHQDNETAGTTKADEDLGEEDIQTSLENELKSLQSDAAKKPALRKFQVVESGARNCLFIRTALPDPVGLVHHIVKDLEETKKQKARFILRMLPIETTCKAYLDDIKQSADPLLTKYFTAEAKSFSILFNCRNNKSVSRENVIDELAQMVSEKNAANRVDLKNPELSVLVEIIRNICCISVLPDYYRFKRYNLLEISGVEQVEVGGGDTGTSEANVVSDTELGEQESGKNQDEETVGAEAGGKEIDEEAKCD